MKIAVVILNWNGKELLEKFLPSVVRNSKSAHIYVADNASSDDSVNFIKEHYPSISIIQNPSNEGYAKGYNLALEQVEEDIYCLLNNDVEVSENWLDPLLEVFENDSDCGIIQPKILDYKKKDRFEYAGAGGGFIDKYAYAYCRGRVFNSIETDKGQYNDIIPIFWASGACLLIRKETFRELNGFDESFFAHYEEIDLCWRAFNLGKNIKYIGTSTVYHLGGATLSALNPKKTYLNFRNSLFTITKNAHGFLFGIVFSRLVLDGVAALRFLVQLKVSHFFAILKAHFSYYANLSRLLQQRKNLNQRPDYYKVRSIVWNYFIRRQLHS